MLLIYTHTITSRLQYVCSFIFGEMQLDFSITSDWEKFYNHSNTKIFYGNTNPLPEAFAIGNTGLLLERGIVEQTIDYFTVKDYKAFFKTAHQDFPFDIFSAVFYLLSRYEEYLPHEKDNYGRYAHTNSVAFKEGFLHLPIINIWVKELAAQIKSKSPNFKPQNSNFKFLPTYDIDIAFSYKHKGLVRNAGGFLKLPSLSRIKVLLGLQKDPFDTFAYLKKLHERYHLKAYYFFLVAEKNGIYDKNILPSKKAMVKLIQNHASKYTVGIHPSWRSGDEALLLRKEKLQLEKISNGSITKSRQHYIRFNLPEGYRKLIDAGITDDYSMGYGSINGFRASVASSFYWYDLQKEEETSLRIHPFCFMEANAFYEQNFTAKQAYDEMMYYYEMCKDVGGQMITIWHNHFFGPDKQFKGWREIYERFIAQVQQ